MPRASRESQRRVFDEAGTCNHNVHRPLGLFHSLVKPIKIAKACYVTLNRRYAFADETLCLFKF